MAKVIKCQCGYVVSGETDDELLANAQKHVEEAHPEMVGKISQQDFLAMAEEV